MNLRIMLSPFIEIKGGNKKIEIPKVKRLCLKHPKSKQENNKFCSECGSEIVSQDYFITEEYSAMDVLNNWDHYVVDRLCSIEYKSNILLPNKYPPNDINVDEESCDFHNLLDKQEIITKQVEWFKKVYEDEIVYLKSQFGEENVVVGWGLIHYWS